MSKIKLGNLFFISGAFCVLVAIFWDYLSGGPRFFGTNQIILLVIGIAGIAAGILILRNSKFYNAINKAINKFIQFDYKKILNSYFPEIAIFLLLFCSLVYSRINNGDISGYAGLYMEASENILNNKFALPFNIQYYGPGGIPFAYPPLGFYICALAIKVLGISILTYVRLAPIFYYSAALIAFYFLIRLITKSRIKGFLSAFLYGVSSVGYGYQAVESGMVRGLALLFSIIALNMFYIVFNNGGRKIWPILIGSLFLACTVLTHFSYSIFLLVSILILFLFGQEKTKQKVTLAVLMFSSAGLLTLPWALTVLTRHGINTFLNTTGTHGGLSYFLRLNSIPSIIDGILKIVRQWGGDIQPELGLVLIGFCYALYKRKWIFPIWFLIIYIFIGEGGRFLYLIGTVLASEVIYDLFQVNVPSNVRGRSNEWSRSALPMLLLMSYFFGVFYLTVLKNPGSIDTQKLADLARWFQNNSAEDASYLFISTNDDYAENIPFFIKRTPEVAPWGGEWKGTYDYQKSIYSDLERCITLDSFACISSLISNKKLTPEYIITINEDTKLTKQIKQAPEWKEVYKNPNYVVYISMNIKE